MLVNEVMTRGAQCVRPDDTLQYAARKMKELDVGPLPVCDNGLTTWLEKKRAGRHLPARFHGLVRLPEFSFPVLLLHLQ
jgi:CBS domain-containing protein